MTGNGAGIMDEDALLKAAENFLKDEERGSAPTINPVKLAALLGDFQARGTSQSIRNALNLLAVECHARAKAKGWYDGRKRMPLEFHALITSEVAEATEAVRDGVPTFCKEAKVEGEASFFLTPEHPAFVDCLGKPEGEAVELMDAVIRIMDYLGSLGIQPGDVLVEKLEFNDRRDYRHGGKTV